VGIAQYPSADEGKNEMWFLYAMKCYSSFKGKEILMHANINEPSRHTSEISQSQKQCYMASSI
jgi:hypothetical protein